MPLLSFLRQPLTPVDSNTALCIQESSYPSSYHRLHSGRVHHDLGLIDQGMMHSHVEHLLKLDRIFSDGDMVQRWKTILLYHLASSADHTECHETFVFKGFNSFGKLLPLLITELLLHHLDGVVGVNFCMGVTFVGFDFFDFGNLSHVDVAVCDVFVDVDDESHRACQEAC